MSNPHYAKEPMSFEAVQNMLSSMESCLRERAEHHYRDAKRNGTHSQFERAAIFEEVADVIRSCKPWRS